MSQQLSTNTFGVAKWIVSPILSNGTHTTWAGAIASASSGDTVLIRDGTYTEDVTLKAGITITALPGDSGIPNVTLIGKVTHTAAGTATINNIRLQTNGDYAIEITGASAANLNLKDCYLNCTNFTGINLNNAAASLSLNGSITNLTTTGIALFNVTTIAGFSIVFSTVANSGLSTTASTMAAGATAFNYSAFAIAMNFSGTATFSSSNCIWNNAPINTSCLTTTSSGANLINSANLSSGTASALTITSGTLRVSDCIVSSSNTNAITGGGALQHGPIEFIGSSSTVNVTTQTPLSIGPRIQLGSGTLGAGGSQLMSGTGSPDTVVTATQGSLFLRKDGSVPYSNTDGATAWSTLGAYSTGSFTPTIVGGTVTGTTTYTTQNGIWTRNGDTMWVSVFVACSAATGTGDVRIGNFPTTIDANCFPSAAMYIDAGGLTWPAGRTNAAATGAGGQTYCNISCSGTLLASARMQMANTAMSFIFGIVYKV